MRDGTTIVFGGCFDPPHLGHHAVVKQLLKIRKVARIFVVPSNHPPHKTPVAPYWQRLEMCRLAFDDVSARVEVLDTEAGISGTGYTCIMMRMLPERFAPYALLLGTDEARSLPYWRSPEVIFERADIIIAERQGCVQLTQKEVEKMELPRSVVDVLLRAGRFALPVDCNVSSTEVRNSISLGEYDWKSMVKPAVAEYIVSRNDYV